MSGQFRPWELYGIDNTGHHLVVYSCFFPGPISGGDTTAQSLVAKPQYRAWTKVCQRNYRGAPSTFERTVWVGPNGDDFGVDFVYATCTIEQQ
jgi:hypothetical protein